MKQSIASMEWQNFKLNRNMRNYESWYFRNRNTFRLLRKHARNLLVNSISIQQQGSIVNVQGRVKDLESFKEKMSSKEYTKPEQIDDMVGLRIIVYTLSDYITAYEIVRQNFDIMDNEMVTKTSGYRARHLIVRFNEGRLRLFEYRQFRGLRFEIQLCTILEHAWNELEHDRGYKGDLPTELHREFLVLAKNLQTIDKKFKKITTKSIRYQKSLSHKKLESIPITAPSLTWYLQRHYGDILKLKEGFGPGSNLDKLIIRRLRAVGLESLADLHSLIPPKFKEIYKKVRKPNEGINFFRPLTHILVIYKFDLFFKKIWTREDRTWFDTHDYLVFRKFRLDLDKFPSNAEFDCSG